MTPSTISSKTSGFLMLLKRRIRPDWRFCRAISLAPTCFKRELASASPRPTSRESSCFKTVSTSARAFPSRSATSCAPIPWGRPGGCRTAFCVFWEAFILFHPIKSNGPRRQPDPSAHLPPRCCRSFSALRGLSYPDQCTREESLKKEQNHEHKHTDCIDRPRSPSVWRWRRLLLEKSTLARRAVCPEWRAQFARFPELCPRVKGQSLSIRLLLRSQACLAAPQYRASARW